MRLLSPFCCVFKYRALAHDGGDILASGSTKPGTCENLLQRKLVLIVVADGVAWLWVVALETGVMVYESLKHYCELWDQLSC